MTRIIAQFKRSTGNAEVGESWTESKSFEIEDKISDIYKWVQEVTSEQTGLGVDIKLTVDQATVSSLDQKTGV